MEVQKFLEHVLAVVEVKLTTNVTSGGSPVQSASSASGVSLVSSTPASGGGGFGSICARHGCNRPRYGSHPFCGRTCAGLMKGGSIAICSRQGCNRPRHGRHPFCGRTCARLATSGSAATCSRHGCNRPRHGSHPFCGRTCAGLVTSRRCPRHHGGYCGQGCPCCRARAGNVMGICRICAHR